MIEITNEQIDRVNLILGGLGKAPNKAFSGIINRGLSTAKSNSSKMIRSVYDITHQKLRTETNVKFRRANSNNLSGHIVFSGHKIPLARFNVTPSQPKNGAMVKARVLKSGAPTPFAHAFVAKMKTGHIGVFERLPGLYMSSRGSRKNKHTQKIGANANKITDQFYGPAMAQMARNTFVIEQLEEEVQSIIDKRVEHEISRILNGYV